LGLHTSFSADLIAFRDKERPGPGKPSLLPAYRPKSISEPVMSEQLKEQLKRTALPERRDADVLKDQFKRSAMDRQELGQSLRCYKSTPLLNDDESDDGDDSGGQLLGSVIRWVSSWFSKLKSMDAKPSVKSFDRRGSDPALKPPVIPPWPTMPPPVCVPDCEIYSGFAELLPLDAYPSVPLSPSLCGSRVFQNLASQGSLT
jgi:hypothetical protein